MGESSTVVSAYTMYRHLQQYCSHPSICFLSFIQVYVPHRNYHFSFPASSMVIAGVTVFFLPFVKTKYENLAISCVFGAVSTVGWNALDVLQAELFPTAVRYDFKNCLIQTSFTDPCGAESIFNNLSLPITTQYCILTD